MRYPDKSERTKLGDFAYKFPPTPRVGLVCPAIAGRIAQLSFFFSRRSFFALTRRKSAVTDRRYRATRMRWTGQIFWLLASGPAPAGRTFFPPSPPRDFGDWPIGSRIQLQQRNCSRFARDFSRRSTFSSSQRTGSRTSRLRSALQDLFTRAVFMKSSQQMLSLRELLLQTTPTFFVADH